MATVSGYALQDLSGKEIQRVRAIPNPMLLPDGNHVHGASPGWSNDAYRIVETSWEVPELPAFLPAEISDRQFSQALAMTGSITTAEALAAVKTGTLPAQLQSSLDAMPADQRFSAEMMLSGATTFERNHPMTIALMNALGWTTQSTDELWRRAAAM